MSQFSSDEEPGKEYDYDPPVGAFPAIGPTAETSVISSEENLSEQQKDQNSMNDPSIASPENGTEISTDEIDRLATEVLYPIQGLERQSDKKIVYTLVGENTFSQPRQLREGADDAENNLSYGQTAAIEDNFPTETIMPRDMEIPLSSVSQHPVEFVGSPIEIPQPQNTTVHDSISSADQLTYETVRAFMDAQTTAIGQQCMQNPVSENFSEAETEAFGVANRTHFDPPTTVLSGPFVGSADFHADMDAVTTALPSAPVNNPEPEYPQNPDYRVDTAMRQEAEQNNPSSRDLAVASYFDSINSEPVINSFSHSTVTPPAVNEQNNPSTRDLAVASYFEEDIVQAQSIANPASVVDSSPSISVLDKDADQLDLAEEDEQYPYLITSEIMSKLRSKAQRYRPILLEVNNLLSEQSLPGHLSPETAKLMHSAAAERTASQMIISDEVEIEILSQPISARVPVQDLAGPVMKNWVALAATFALFLAIFVVLVNILVSMINFVDGTILGISLGVDPHAWSSIFGAAHMTLFPPSPLAPGDAVLVIFAYPLVMCITLVVARYLVLTFGARNIFILSALAYSIIGYIISRVTSLTAAGYLLGTWGAAGSFLLVSAVYLLNRLRSDGKIYRYTRSVTVLFFLWLIPGAALLFLAVHMNYLLSGGITVISFLIIFNISSNNYDDMPVAKGRDIIGTILTIVLIGIIGWTFIEGEYWQLVETTKIWAYLLAIVVLIAFLIYESISPRSFFSRHKGHGTLSTLIKYVLIVIGSLLWNFVIFEIAFYIASWNQLNLKNVSFKVLPLILGLALGIFVINLMGQRISAEILRVFSFIIMALAIVSFMKATQSPTESSVIFLSEILLITGAVLLLRDFVRFTSWDNAKLSMKIGVRSFFLGVFFIQLFGLVCGLILPALGLIQKRSEILFASSQNSVSTLPLTVVLGGKKITGEVLNTYASGNALYSLLYVPLYLTGVGLLIALISLGFSKKNTRNSVLPETMSDLVS